MRDDFFKNGYEIIKNIDKTSEALYQRKVEADGMLQIVLKQIVLFSQLLAGEERANDVEKLQNWAYVNQILLDAVEQKDIIMIADILHFEVKPAIKALVD